MDNKHKIAFFILGGVAITQFGVGMTLMGKYTELQKRYTELYELAAYMAGKAEGAGVELDEADRLNMKALKPN